MTVMLDCTDRFAGSMRDLNDAMSKVFGSGMAKKVTEPESRNDRPSSDTETAKKQKPSMMELEDNAKQESDTTIPAGEPKTEEVKQEPEPAKPVEDKKETAIDPAKDYTAEDVRKAMHEARLKIEGADYETNQQGEGYVKYHKLLSKEFVSIAKLLGSDKPSALPAERRAEFINDCRSLIVKSDGTIGREIPF